MKNSFCMFILISGAVLISVVAFEPQLVNQTFAFFGFRNDSSGNQSEHSQVSPHFPVTPLPNDMGNPSFSAVSQENFPTPFFEAGFTEPPIDQAGYASSGNHENPVQQTMFEGNFPPGGFPTQQISDTQPGQVAAFSPQGHFSNSAVYPNEIPVYQANIPQEHFFPVSPMPPTSPSAAPAGLTGPPADSSFQPSGPTYSPPMMMQPNSVQQTSPGGFSEMPQPPQPVHFPAQQEAVLAVPPPSPSSDTVNYQTSVASAATIPSVSANSRDIQVESKIAELEFLTGAEVLAKVGTELILLCDVMPEVRMRAEMIATEQSVPEEARENFYKEVEKHLLPSILEQKIIFAVYYMDAKTSMAKEQLASFEGQIATAYDRAEIARLIELHEVTSRSELDKKLQTYGSSLEREKKDFVRMLVGREWLSHSSNVQETSLITQQDMIDYYEQHKEEKFRHEARARWEELAVSFAQTPDENQAWNMIAEMGNRVVRGEPFTQVAKQYSHGITASSGGEWEWCHPGSLRSEMLDHAIFSLPVGKLSTIFQDETGFHIIRVIEREGVRYTPFEKVHNELRKGIQEERLEANRKKYDEAVFKKFQIAISPKIDINSFNEEFKNYAFGK